MKKYTFTDETINHYGIQLRRIKRVSDGELGGFIEKEENLSQEGNCWVYGNARVCGDARVYGDAWVCGNARVFGDARVYGDAWVYGNTRVCGDAQVFENAQVYGNAWVFGNARVYGNAQVYGIMELVNLEIDSNESLYNIILPNLNSLTICMKHNYFQQNTQSISKDEIQKILASHGISLKLDNETSQDGSGYESRFTSIIREL